MTTLHAGQALTPSGWLRDVRIVVEDGRIASVQANAAAEANDEVCAVLLPAVGNVHSHAFQRGMAGLAETRGSSADSFWSWRDTMYRFALSMTPEQVEAVAAQLYVEMLEAGFGRVGEFHYLHHDRNGQPYAAPAEMAQRIVAAAGDTGIGLTLLPVFYAHAGFGGIAPSPLQRRFVCGLDLYARLLEESRAAVAALPGGVVGVAPHSLRAVTPDELGHVLDMAGGGPIHIHVAEQMREVEDCRTWSGARPVQWLLEHAAVDPRWCLIHATHMTGEENEAVVRRGATVGLCPITEASLGDGVFDASRFVAAGGRFGIGSDSNVLVGLGDELRQLEYSQRLKLRARNVLAQPGGSTGRFLFDAALAGGAAALGAPLCGLAPGAPADMVSLDVDDVAFAGRGGDALLDSLVFSARGTGVDSVWTAGRKRVEAGRHVERERVAERFRRVMADLASR
ncbi:formimidoylglutamate deiminase [Alsobacter sp. SYSU M60028]|uniref:Formimidoylglutamate deiminase n=1 Tax=Alsobacter ponti TaxID=2962936 RepID=A0ABT1L8P4_9HYPH|nr:formimidoylglutamate deiminase [Alsobacter ponti]MCP8937100.1 formimidoylglutamate deiminase [Alsobacter ponti]